MKWYFWFLINCSDKSNFKKLSSGFIVLCIEWSFHVKHIFYKLEVALIYAVIFNLNPNKKFNSLDDVNTFYFVPRETFYFLYDAIVAWEGLPRSWVYSIVLLLFLVAWCFICLVEIGTAAHSYGLIARFVWRSMETWYDVLRYAKDFCEKAVDIFKNAYPGR